MSRVIPKLNEKEKAVVDLFIKELEEEFKQQIERLLKENIKLRERNKVLEDKIVRRNIV